MNDRFRDVATYLVPAAAALAGLVIGVLARRLVLPHLTRAAERSTWKYDDVAVEALKSPLVLWCTLAGLYAAVEILQLPAKGERAVAQVLLVVAIFSVTWALARFTTGALRAGTSEGALPSVSLIAHVAAAGIYVLGALVVLERLGISITPIVTALGVGGLAVALALQDTLANLFAGIRILAARKLRPGDYVRLDSGDEGYVQDITWGQTTIRHPLNHLVIVPNTKLASAISANYNLPGGEEIVVVKLAVAHGSDLAQVERVTVEVARESQRAASGGVAAFEPVVRFGAFTETAVEFSVVLQARHFDQRFLLTHDFLMRVYPRYRAEGIALSQAVRVVRLQDQR
jgi:small-conductance mechanosensitive channel